MADGDGVMHVYLPANFRKDIIVIIPTGDDSSIFFSSSFLYELIKHLFKSTAQKIRWDILMIGERHETSHLKPRKAVGLSLPFLS